MQFGFNEARTLRRVGAIAFGVAMAVFGAQALAQSKPYKAPRNEFGQPDLQGNWNNATLTAVERDPKFGDRMYLTDDEAAQIEGYAEKHREEGAKPTDPSLKIQDLPKDCGYGFSGTNCGYNNFWVDRGTQVIRVDGKPRSSMIIAPANGRVPPLLPEARQRQMARQSAFRKGAGPMDGPEIRSLGERCLMSFGSSAGPPMLPLMYNNTYSIAQTKDTVLIVVEMVHDARVIRLNGKPLPKSVSKWMGDSIGHYEGDTLVIETTNFNPSSAWRGSDENLKVTERLTRVAPDQILYRFTVEDPTAFTAPFTGELPMNFTPDKQYEYACHEGNYALPGILAGAREEERQAAANGKQVKQRSLDEDAKGE